MEKCTREKNSALLKRKYDYTMNDNTCDNNRMFVDARPNRICIRACVYVVIVYIYIETSFQFRRKNDTTAKKRTLTTIVNDLVH